MLEIHNLSVTIKIIDASRNTQPRPIINLPKGTVRTGMNLYREHCVNSKGTVPFGDPLERILNGSDKAHLVHELRLPPDDGGPLELESMLINRTAPV